MKKLSRYILLAAVLILFIGLAPRFLSLDATQNYIAEKLGDNLGSTVTIDKIKWEWLPVPHISLVNTTISNENSRLTLPEISINAHWRMFYTSELLPEKFILENPDIFLRIKGGGEEKSISEYAIPRTNIFIKNGTFKVQTDGEGDHQTVLEIGYADIDVLKTDTLLSININSLFITNPQFKLSGIIERNQPAQESDTETPVETPEPVWTLDLNGRDLDLTAIRESVLALWKDHIVARTVCDIVRGGRAKTGAYRFFGTLNDFNELDNMIIEADPYDASIHVPAAELDLTSASGPVLIKDSILTGNNLSAHLDDSFGSNASLLLDLSDRTRSFKLDIDIDADLKALPPVLERLVDHKGFQKELSRFKNVTGRATGNLQLGDTLDNIITRVDVASMQLSTDYDPIPQTVIINQGGLQVRSAEVNWQNVQGSIAQQKVSSTSGKVAWDTGKTLLEIEALQGQLDGETLLEMLEDSKAMPARIKKSVASIKGPIHVSKGKLHGSAALPETWKYQLTAKSEDLIFSTPLLPEPVTVNGLSAEITHEQVNVLSSDIRFLDQPLNLKGTFAHHELENWYGSLVLNGPLQDKLADWLSNKGWFSEKMRPRIPCTLEDMKVSFKKETIGVSGKILQGLAWNKNLPMAKIDLESTPAYLHIKELTFYTKSEHGTLTLNLQRQSPKSLVLSWQGFVNAATIDSLFQHSIFVDGAFSGAYFEAGYFGSPLEETQFKGVLKAENLLLKKSGEDKEPIIFQNVLLNGTGRQMNIPYLEIDIGPEKITGSGNLATERNDLHLDINLASSFISKKSLDDLTARLKGVQHSFLEHDTGQDEEPLIPRDWDVSGRIGFDFDSFSTSRYTSTLYTGTKLVNYTLYKVHGELQMAPGSILKTEILSSNLCGLNFRSTWFSQEALGQHFEIETDPSRTLYLENVLPCLGIDQDLIEGEFSLKANLRKESGEWHAGNVYLKSTKGRILRLQALSKIFKIVNITDLFVTDVGTTGKKGFPFSRLDIDTHINENYLIFDRAILHGEGLNLFLQGDVHLADYDADLTLLIAPFKTFDTLVSKVPIVGQSLMSEYDSLVAIPVSIKGTLPDPVITPLQFKAVSDSLFNVVKETFKLPYNILKPKEPSDK
jgi:hypothetical protein